MALTRKMLAAMDIPAEKIDEIINAHTETLAAIKEERDNYKLSAEKLPGVEKKLTDAQAEIEKFKSGDWENKYNTVKGEFDSFKTETAAKETKAKKETAYKQLLLDAGISDKRIGSVLKVTSLDGIELGEDGKIKDADKVTESVKKEWADFITTTGEQGAKVPNPPANDGNGGTQQSRAAQLAAQYKAEHYGIQKED